MATDAPADREFHDFMIGRWPGLVRLAYGLTGDQPLAEDLAQTALTRAYASWPRCAGRMTRTHTSGRSCQLVHSDYNPKNLLAARQGGRWAVTAVLDWEFAFSGSPLNDIGNMLRPRPAATAGLAAGFVAGYREAGGKLPAGWREISEALDLYALADLLTRPAGHRYRRQAVALIRARLARA